MGGQLHVMNGLKNRYLLLSMICVSLLKVGCQFPCWFLNVVSISVRDTDKTKTANDYGVY